MSWRAGEPEKVANTWRGWVVRTSDGMAKPCSHRHRSRGTARGCSRDLAEKVNDGEPLACAYLVALGVPYPVFP